MANKPTLSESRVADLHLLTTVDGEISNQRIREVFGLERVQATRLLQAYFKWRTEQGLPELRRWGAVWSVPAQPAADHVSISQIGDYIALNPESGPEPWLLDCRHELACTPLGVLTPLRRACLQKSPVEIAYTSLTSEGSSNRVIYPHAVVQAGRRLHVRAWCAQRLDYRDFALPRIEALRDVEHHQPPRQPDRLWEKNVALRLRAHELLGPQQELAVRREFFGGTMGRRLDVRGALVHYVINGLEAAIDPKTEKPPRFQLQVANIDEIRQYLFGGYEGADKR